MSTRVTIFGAGIFTLLGGEAWGQLTQRVSVDSAGVQGNGTSFAPSISADGRYVAFYSYASNLVPGDANGHYDVFVRDRQSGAIECVSVASSGTQGDGPSWSSSISADGRYVAFHSFAGNLVAGDTNVYEDVFVRDRQSGTTERVSISSTGMQGNSVSVLASISADGRYVAFESAADNLVAGDTNLSLDVFVRDRHSGTTERVSVDSAGTQVRKDSFTPSISADGRFVAFASLSNDLVPGTPNGWSDVFIHDRQSGATERVSVDSGEVQANGESRDPTISADGRYVAFTSEATNLVPGDTNGILDLFLRDRQSGTTDRVSIGSGGTQGNSFSSIGSLSADGRYVAFSSFADNLVPGDTNGDSDAFLRDRQNGTTERVSVDSNGAQGNGRTLVPAISADGRLVAFQSSSSNLVSGDTNAYEDVFVRDRDASGFASLCDPGLAGVIPCPCSNPPSGSGRGCDNFGSGPVGSGTLTATGVAYLSMDSVVLHATGENNTSLTVFWTGTALVAPPGVVHGAGVRCVSGLKRLYTGSASGGAISRPAMGDPSVSTAGGPISAGETRYYFTIYRDPNAAVPCGSAASTVNLTNVGSITWNQ